VTEDHTIPVDRVPGSIPCDHCLDHLEERLRLGLLGKRAETASSPARIWAAWANFRDDPSKETWRPFVFLLAALDKRQVQPPGDNDPWPMATIGEIDSADRLWLGGWMSDD
jgi:hypothetical protein